MNNHYTLITGAASDIGNAIAKKLSKEHNLILNDIRRDDLIVTERKCGNLKNYILWPFDFNNIFELGEDLKDFLITNKIFIDSFIHLAGIFRPFQARSIDLKSAKEIFNVSFFSSVEIIKILLKKKVNQSNLRSIIFISSISSKFGAKGFNIYSASKGALDSLMKSLAVELAPQVRVNSILPGGIRTKSTEHLYRDPTLLEKMSKDYLLGFGKTEDIANLIDFIISEKARWITGQQIIIDGGKSVF